MTHVYILAKAAAAADAVIIDSMKTTMFMIT